MEKEINGKMYVLKPGNTGCKECEFDKQIASGCLEAGLECLEGATFEGQAVRHWEKKHGKEKQ